MSSTFCRLNRLNTYRGDASYTTDVRAQRTFSFTERFKGEASLEVFNLFSRQEW